MDLQTLGEHSGEREKGQLSEQVYILPFEKHILYICVLASSHRIYRLHHLVLFVLHLHRRWRWWIIMSAPRILSDLLGMQISNTIGGLIACPPLCLCSLSSFTGTVVVQHDVLFVSLSRHFRSCYIAHTGCFFSSLGLPLKCLSTEKLI